MIRDGLRIPSVGEYSVCSACGEPIVFQHNRADLFLNGPNWLHFIRRCPGPKVHAPLSDEESAELLERAG